MTVYLVLEVGRAPAAAQVQLDRPVAGRTAPAEVTASRTDVEAPRRAVLPDRIIRRPREDDRPPVTDSPPPQLDTPDLTPATIVRANPKLDAIMSEANKAYDRGDFDEAKEIAQKVLARAPGNVRMLRILVSADCITGDNAEAQKNFLLLPPRDRAQMQVRCDRYGVTLAE
jgi:hypothetical protein